MMDDEFADELEKLFDHGQQIWLLGAGASVESNLPLMYGLTECVVDALADEPLLQANGDEIGSGLLVGDFIEVIRGDIGKDATIEGILDHISDYASLARRGDGGVNIPFPKGGADGDALAQVSLRFDALMKVRAQILGKIRETIRWGYVHSEKHEDCNSGKPGCSIVKVVPHLDFAEALFDGVLAARQRRLRPVEFFTTNYDTLIEDALALKGVRYVDGFRGGAVGYWDHSVYADCSESGSGVQASITKIHGSIDWALTPDQKIIRRRIGDMYPSGDDGGEVLIYPQATKYEYVRREPFDSLFQRFRSVLARNKPQVLFICGYGFGDEHVDRELEEALAHHDSQLTIIAFSKERGEKLKQWGSRSFGERLYVLTEQGAWCGNNGPYLKDNKPHDWWTFTGMTKLVQRGGRVT